MKIFSLKSFFGRLLKSSPALLAGICLSFFVTTGAFAQQGKTTAAAKALPIVRIETTKGTMLFELYPDKAPITVANFLGYVNDGFYNGLIFHRVVKRFAIQTGGYDEDFQEREATRGNIPNESHNKLWNDRFTLAMARQEDPDSASSQFYINLGLNMSLNASRGKPGYTVFGKMLEGEHVALAIGKVATESFGGFENVPKKEIVVKSITLVNP